MRLSNALTDAQWSFHHALFLAIDALDGDCEADGCTCEVDKAIRALLAIIYRHRLEANPTAPDGSPPLFPGYRSLCAECKRNYPCSTICDVAWDVMVDVPEELSDGVVRSR